MMVQSTHKGFAYRLGHGLGSAVACVRAGERRVLVSAGRVGVPFRLMVKTLLLAIKLGVVAALVVALLPALSWLMSAVFGAVLLAGLAYLSVGAGDESAYATFGRDDMGRKLDSHGASTSDY